MSKNANSPPALVWLRNDLRMADNPALAHALASGAPVLPVYILDDDAPHAPGGAARWWLHHSLNALAKSLADAGAPLILRRGPAAKTLKALIAECSADTLYWNRRYYPGHVAADKTLKADLTADGVTVHTFSANLLREPWELQTKAGGHFKVFTPFWRALQQAGPARDATAPTVTKFCGPQAAPASERLSDWTLAPTAPNWANEFASVWSPGEKGAHDRLHEFLEGNVNHYADGRDRPDMEFTSRLSPHLAFGEISPLTIWKETRSRIDAGDISPGAAEKFLSEIAWREFACNLLFHHGDLPDTPLRKEFGAFQWRDDQRGFDAWTSGQTGYPIVDAGMRQLWRTGWMHNRVRMIVASFLIKDLLIPWQRGQAWFWDTLVDADLANNAASWQWVAGCGADASPYFRIFNPMTQGRKFDPDGDYVRKFVPELSAMPAKHIHAPWEAPENVLRRAGVTLGKTYPMPILDHATARQRALDHYAKAKAG